jgi:NAD(P)-dependent dehydrogenase (short-subunit alcohol dehydrogenase family)
MKDFKGKVAVVTGGASGIGRELCRQLGGHGATVIVADINREGAEEVASSIAEAGGRARAALVDVTDAEEMGKLIQDTAAEFGGLHYMFNNAGIAIGGEARDMDWEHWRRMLDINLMGVIHGSRAAYSLMVAQGLGHIVNTASGAGLFPIANSTPYVMTKHGVVGLSRSLRAEGADLGVKVSVVCPAMVDTPIFDAAAYPNLDRKRFVASIPRFLLNDVNHAVRAILRGVSRNQGIIIDSWYGRLMWWTYRYLPALTHLGNRFMVRDTRRRFRLNRAENKGKATTG